MPTDPPADEITRLLLECETKLRTLQQQGRLSGVALQTFTALSANVKDELERRTTGERRAAPRTSADRRVTLGLQAT
jgi:hypothetical protein